MAWSITRLPDGDGMQSLFGFFDVQCLEDGTPCTKSQMAKDVPAMVSHHHVSPNVPESCREHLTTPDDMI